MEKVVELEQVSRSFRRGDEVVSALADLSLSLVEGEVAALVGPSDPTAVRFGCVVSMSAPPLRKSW
jgi:predicted ABC-type transport system involved in lysophospholipase L1 biosynthesis ATPase subunit